METAVPINHSLLPSIEFIEDVEDNKSEKAIAQLSLEPGWELLEAEIKTEIERLKVVEYQGEDINQYGFKCLASSLCISKLEWIINRVRSTERALREQGESGD